MSASKQLSLLQVLPNTQVAQTLAGALSSMFSLFAGFLISPAKIPDPWLFAFYLNPLHYVVEVSSAVSPVTTFFLESLQIHS